MDASESARHPTPSYLLVSVKVVTPSGWDSEDVANRPTAGEATVACGIASTGRARGAQQPTQISADSWQLRCSPQARISRTL